MFSKNLFFLTSIVFLSTLLFTQAQETDKLINNALQWRSVGPAFNSGRIADIEINPKNHDEWYIASASGGLWKTSNHGNTFQPIFDKYGSYSLACITMDPKNSNILWLGTGENNNQRSVAYGDGVYKSLDGGKSWKNVGLEKSEHIGNIIVHPDHSETVFVAAYGPLWSEGGDRGIYRTKDGGTTWKRILEIDAHTGFNEIHFDPKNPEIMYATAHQRRRHVWTYISGGPSSAIYKSTDGGDNWRKLESGLPKGDLGRISVTIAPSNANIVYAIIEGSKKAGGFYKSTDKGESWKKQSDYQTSGNYYVEIYCDPYNSDKIFSMDTWLHHSEDGGKSFKKTGEKSKHVDNHDIWIDPTDTDHWLVACDGGLYETWDHAANWHYKANLPLTQFYKVALDNDFPFYNIYGGTQDNNTLGGPSRTTNIAGIMNSDWYVTRGGDGFKSQIDPTDPNIIYSQAQYGMLARFDKKTGERINIQPMPGKGEEGLVFNWDAPLLISPHNHKRLYFAADKLFRSDDYGNNWNQISNKLPRGLDRNQLKVMDRVWEIDAVAKNRSTTIYGNITALDESPLKEDRLIVGTDDGLLHFSDQNQMSWRKVDNLSGIPERCYVNDCKYSLHDENRVYAVFNNHKNGDFKPYILRSNDNGIHWSNIAGNLPERGSVYCIVEDHLNSELLFCGTEFGAYYSNNSGITWTKINQGIPNIAIRDLVIQKRENDLVAASFGRGFYILDNYSLLRNLEDIKSKEAHIFNIKNGLAFNQTNPLGTKGKSNQGEALFTSKNPPVGVAFDYYLKDKQETLKQIRNKKEEELRKSKRQTIYPSHTEISDEDRERKSKLLFVIKDKDGKTIRKISQEVKNGINRVYWDARVATLSPTRLKPKSIGRYSNPDWGTLVADGTYSVSMFLETHNELKELVNNQEFKVNRLFNLNQDSSPAETAEFQTKTAELMRSLKGSNQMLSETDKKLKLIAKSIESSPSLPLEMLAEVHEAQEELSDIKIVLHGNSSLQKRYYSTPPGLYRRAYYAYQNTLNNTQAPTGTAREMYNIASEEYYGTILSRIQGLVKKATDIESKMDKLGAPYTPGRGQEWKED